MGEYIGRVYTEVKGRPLYLVRDRFGFDPKTAPSDQPTEAGQLSTTGTKETASHGTPRSTTEMAQNSRTATGGS